MCRSTRWFVLLAIVAGVVLCSIPSLATTWSAYSDFNTASATGTPWSYGFADLANVPGAYSITNPGYSLTAFRGDIYSPGFSWLYNSTWKNNSGDDLAPMVGVFTGTGNYWIFTPQGVYLEPADAHGYAPVVRWIAPSAGTYSYSGSMTDVNGSNHNARYWIVKHSASGTYTTLDSGTLLGSSPTIPTNIIGSTAMAANDSIDVLVANDASYWMRPFVRLDLTINSAEPPGVKGYVQNSAGVRIEGATVSNGTQSVTTAYDGTYTLVTTPPGTYTISASKPSYATVSASAVIGTSGLVTQNFTLPAGNTISGTVTSNSGGIPLSGVSIVTSDGVYSSSTNSAGYYSMMVTPGTYNVGYSHIAFLPKTETVDATSASVVHSVGLNIGWDAANDFSTSSNPSDNWQMGYLDSAGTYDYDHNSGGLYDPRVFDWCHDWGGISATNCKNLTVLPFTLNDSQSNPYIEGGKLIFSAGYPESAVALFGSWAVGHFWNNNTAVARFISPASGPYTVTARFGAASTTGDAYVPVALRYKPVGGAYTYWLGQATSPRSANMTFVDGFQGRAVNGYTDSVGTTPVVTYSNTLNLHVGDIVEALVGFNAQTITGTDSNLDVNSTKSLGRWVQTDLTVSIPATYGTILGTVRCANQAGNPPVEGVTVTATSGGQTFVGLTDATGVYFISLPAGSYTLSATNPAYATGTDSASVSAGGAHVVNFNLNGNFAATMAQLKSYAVGQGVIMTTPMQLASGIVNTNQYLGTMYAFDKRYGSYYNSTDSTGPIQVATPEYAFYLQSDDRTSGIKCVYDGVAGLGSTYDPTWRVACSGVMALDSTGQKVFNVTSISGDAQIDPPAQPRPLGKTSKGLTNSGTLVKVWGKITDMQANTLVPPENDGVGHLKYSYEYINITDGGQTVKIPMHCQYNWVTTLDASISDLHVGDYVSVTGIAGTTTGSDVVVYPRCQTDIYDYTAAGR